MTIRHIIFSNTLLAELKGVHQETVAEARAHHFYISNKAKKGFEQELLNRNKTLRDVRNVSVP